MGYQTFPFSQSKSIICSIKIGKNTLSTVNLKKDFFLYKKKNSTHTLTMTKCGLFKYA